MLQEMVRASHDLILFTMRSGEPLAEAILWFDEHQIPLYGVNSNPTQHEWTSSPKAYAGLYIDDAALGCPLLYEDGNRPYVNWIKARELLERRGVFSG